MGLTDATEREISMNIVFDLDNTLTDEFGAGVRPGIDNLLDKLQKEGHTLILWTGSTRERAIHILKEHRLYYYFQKFIFREDYDPNNQGVHKDIRKVNGDLFRDVTSRTQGNEIKCNLYLVRIC